MKSYAILVLMLACVAVAVYMHGESSNRGNEADKLGAGLKGVEQIVPKGAHISFRTEPGQTALLGLSRYFMAPTYLDLNNKYDTTLSIQYTHDGDSVLNAFVADRQPIWQHRDSQYIYSLTIAR